VRTFAPILKDGIDRLVNAGANVIGVPCNTVHSFFSKYTSHIPGVVVVSIVERTVYKVAKELKCKKVGVLGTTTTIESELYSEPLKKAGVQVKILPKEK